MSEPSTSHGLANGYHRIQAMVRRMPTRLRSLDISWIRMRRDGTHSSSTTATPAHDTRRSSDEPSIDTHGCHRRPPPPPPPPQPPPLRRESTQSLFGSADSSQASTLTAQSPTATGAGGGQQPLLSRPPHSHLYRHSSHYPLLLGSYNNWSAAREHRLIAHLTATDGNGVVAGGDHNADKERNVLSAIMSIVVIATLATALAQPKWFSINGGLCPRKYIGLQEFFYVGNFNGYHFDVNKAKSGTTHNHNNRQKTVDSDGVGHQVLTGETMLLYGVNGDLKNCVTPEIVTLQRLIIGLSFFAIMFNLIQFFFDTLGVRKKWLNAVRSHALGNILGVLLCVVIVGVAYLVSTLLEKQQHRLLKEQHRAAGAAAAPVSPDAMAANSHVEVKFELSYYLVTFSGLLAIIAAASNLLRRPQHYYIDATDAFW
ncbi:unnamed protein product, partial [Oppiella nova]